MTIDDAKKLLAEMEGWRDPEVCHSHEDDIARAAIGMVIAGHPDAMEMCRRAMQSFAMEGSRWCA